MEDQQPMSATMRLTAIVTGTRRRKIAAIIVLMMMGAALFDPADVNDAQVTLSTSDSGEDDLQQIESMLAELERDATSAQPEESPSDENEVAASTVLTSDESDPATTSLMIPSRNSDIVAATSESDFTRPAPSGKPAGTSTQPVSYPGTERRSTTAAQGSQRRRPDSSAPLRIRLTGTIDPI